jgi:pimeloyl-ACP methyl ester carboxylesterase
MTDEVQRMLPTFVLVHGAWQSAATWDLVRPKLEQAGYEVSVPELTGLESSASLTPDVDLATHIEDVARAVRAAPGDVTLVGHSYAGMIISGVAEKVDNIARLVYVDAFVPEDGQSALDLLPEAIAGMFRERAQADGEGWRLRAGEGQLDLWGLKPGPAREFARERLTDFSLRCFEQPVNLRRNAVTALPRTYIAATAEDYPARPVFQPFADKARRRGWAYFELPTGHDCHVEMPDAFVELLVSAAVSARAEG